MEQTHNESSITPGSNLPTGTPPVIGNSGNKKKNQIIGGMIVVVILLAGFFAYQVYASPARIWQKFATKIQTNNDRIVHENFTVAYQDNGELTDSQQQSSPYAGMLSKIKFLVSGDAYVNMFDAKNLEMIGNFSYTFGSGGTSFSAQMNAIAKGQDFFIKIGDIPFFSGALTQINNGQKVDWIKFNLQALEQELKAQNKTDAAPKDFNQQMQAYQAIEQKHLGKLVSMGKPLGKETIHNVSTVHYSVNVNKPELKSMVNEMLAYAADQTQKMDASTTPETAQKAKELIQTAVGILVDRTQIKTFDLWVGSSDYRIYKVAFSSSMPSIVSLVAVGGDASKDSSLSSDPQKMVNAVLNKVAFDGQFDFTQEFFDYGKKQDVTVPQGALDIVEKIKEQDAKNKNSTLPITNSILTQ